MLIGYARVSTQEQNLDRQLKALEDAKVEKIFQDKASGKDNNRPQFQSMLEFARSGDTIVVQSLDRLGRNYDAIKATIQELNNKGISLQVLDAPFLNLQTGNETLDKALSDMLISLLGYIADNERKKTLERQAQGIAIAKQKGIYKGKPLEYSPQAKDPKKRAVYNSIVSDLQAGLAIAGIAKKYGVTRKLVYRIKADLESVNL